MKALLFAAALLASSVWVPDGGHDIYKNPIIYADYSDPDVIRAGSDFYLVSSSFNAIPGLPILQSKDLVNWTIIGHALMRQPPFDVYSHVRHGAGVWAPAIRYHGGEFFIFYPDPDYGIYMVKAKSITGPWTQPLLIKASKGWEDPCPLWDDDGSAYLINAFAASRSGIKSILVISRMSADGSKLLDDGVVVYDGHANDPTIEGPKLYKRNGYYYISAPAGGVANGWQVVLRSKSIYGPYERKAVLAQGGTPVNGPHQGAWVDTPAGEYWFIHFQDEGAYGRITWLEPMKWVNDWPVIGANQNNEGTGQPVLSYRKPNIGKTYGPTNPQTSDEFNSSELGLQWQWHANPDPEWGFPAPALGAFRLMCFPLPENFQNLWDVPNLLLQKFPAPEFTVTTKVSFSPRSAGDKAGLIIMGVDYAYLGVENSASGFVLSQSECHHADRHQAEKQNAAIPVSAVPLYLRVHISPGASCQFSYSIDGTNFTGFGNPFTAQPGKWIGAKVGLFAVTPRRGPEMGNADFDWFRVE